jgi:hypothetical protein
MNENDLRDCFAMFAMMSRKFTENKELDAAMCYQVADLMVEARKKEPEEDGIATIKKRVRKS